MKNDNQNELQSNFPKVGAPALRALAGAGYERLEQLANVSEAELKKLHGMGPSGIATLRKALEAQGLSFADKKKAKS
jgi:ERCC4-type nuclease